MWYLPDAETHKRYACFVAGVAYEDLDSTRHDWEMAVDALVNGTAHLVQSPDTAREWSEHLRILRNEWRVTESTVRSMPIAYGRWPCEPPFPPARLSPAHAVKDGSSADAADTPPTATGQQSPEEGAGAPGATEPSESGDDLPAWLVDPKYFELAAANGAAAPSSSPEATEPAGGALGGVRAAHEAGVSGGKTVDEMEAEVQARAEALEAMALEAEATKALREKILASLSREVAAEAAESVRAAMAAGDSEEVQVEALREKMLASLSREVAAEAAAVALVAAEQQAEAMREKMLASLAREVAAEAAAGVRAALAAGATPEEQADALHAKMLASLTKEVAAEAAAGAMSVPSSTEPSAELDATRMEALREKMLASLTKEVAAEAAEGVREAMAAGATEAAQAEALREKMLASLTKEVAAEAAAGLRVCKGAAPSSDVDALRDKLLASLTREVVAEAAEGVRAAMVQGRPEADQVEALREKMLASLTREVAAEAASGVRACSAPVPASSGPTVPSGAAPVASDAQSRADEEAQLVALEALHTSLRRAGFAWRRANRVFESKARRMLRLHGITPPPYAPGVLLPAPTLLAAIATTTRASIFHGAGFLRRTRPKAEAAAARALALAVDARKSVAGAGVSAWQALPVAARAKAAEAVKPAASAASSAGAAAVGQASSLCERLGQHAASAWAWARGKLQACGITVDSPRSMLGESRYTALEEAAAPWTDARMRRSKLGGLAGQLQAAWRRYWSLSLFTVFSAVFGLVFVSELFLVLQFPRHFSWAPDTPPSDAPSGFTPTPLGWLLSLGEGPDEVNEVGLFFFGVLILMACGWSLNQLEMGLFWYRMVQPYATDTSSLAFNSAIFCRIAVVLVLNVDMLVLPLEANEIRTSQTRFYCQFGKKARLTVPTTDGHDYVLIIMPLLISCLVASLYFNLLSRIKAACARFLHDERVPTFRFGRAIVTWHEERGSALLRDLQIAYSIWAQQTIVRAWRRHAMRQQRGPALEVIVTSKASSPLTHAQLASSPRSNSPSGSRRRLSSASAGPVGSAPRRQSYSGSGRFSGSNGVSPLAGASSLSPTTAQQRVGGSPHSSPTDSLASPSATSSSTVGTVGTSGEPGLL